MEYHIEQSILNSIFTSIAKRYDLLNDILSFGIQRLWREALYNELPILDGRRILDLSTGSGALLPGLIRESNFVVGIDICREMIRQAPQKITFELQKQVAFVEADAHMLPILNASVDLVTVAFGVRNYAELEKALCEIKRVLRENGQLLIIELGQPKSVFPKLIYSIYSFCIFPLIGAFIARNPRAYWYLFKSSSSFPCGRDFERILIKCGFSMENTRALNFGIAYLYKARNCPHSLKDLAKEES